jgi:hypothetical protein
MGRVDAEGIRALLLAGRPRACQNLLPLQNQVSYLTFLLSGKGGLKCLLPFAEWALNVAV